MEQHEIKFRAWDKQKNEMIYDGIEFHSRQLHEPGPEEGEEESFIGFGSLCFRRFIMMQWTGMKDCRGKEIYEGDILRSIDDPQFDVIVRFGDSFSEIHEDHINTFVGFYGGFINQEHNNCEINPSVEDISKVIGNIHENPELIKSQPLSVKA